MKKLASSVSNIKRHANWVSKSGEARELGVKYRNLSVGTPTGHSLFTKPPRSFHPTLSLSCVSSLPPNLSPNQIKSVDSATNPTRKKHGSTNKNGGSARVEGIRGGGILIFALFLFGVPTFLPLWSVSNRFDLVDYVEGKHRSKGRSREVKVGTGDVLGFPCFLSSFWPFFPRPLNSISNTCCCLIVCITFSYDLRIMFSILWFFIFY